MTKPKSPDCAPFFPGKTYARTSKILTTKAATLILEPAMSPEELQPVPSLTRPRRTGKPRSVYPGKSLLCTTKKFPKEKMRRMKMKRR